MGNWRRLWLIGPVLLAACAPAPNPQSPARPDVPAQFPQRFYFEARAAGQPVLRIDPARSMMTVGVHRAGALARLGHDHVISAPIHGYVLWPAQAPQARADLYLALAALEVDNGPASMLSHEDAAATRRNMLDKVLDAGRHPFLLVRAVCADGNCSEVDATIALHGMSRQFRFPVRIAGGGPGGLVADGDLQVRHSDFGLTPYRILGGALQVEDRMDVTFHLVAVAI